MRLYDTLNLVIKNLKPFNKKVVSKNLLNQILASDIKATKNNPSYDNSALDGYAIKHNPSIKKFKIIDEIFAGDSKIYRLDDENFCYKIATGAKIPTGSNTIIRYEDVRISGEFIECDELPPINYGIRRLGEDFKINDILLCRGDKISAKEKLILSANGIDEAEIYKKPKIAIFSNGNELVEVGEACSDDKIYNSNAYGIMSILQSFDFEASYLGILRDNFDEIKENFINQINNFDVIITSAGAGNSEADFMDKIAKELNMDKIFDHIDIKPGRPMRCYSKGDKILFILPGNPMAAYLLCYLLIIPTLRFLINEKEFHHFKFSANLLSEISAKNRDEIIIGHFDGENFTPIKLFNSASISELSRANSIFIAQNSAYGINSKIELIRLI